MKSLNIALLIARIGLGINLMLHGYFKLFNGVSSVKNHIISLGLPGWLCFSAYIAEIVMPMLLMLGLFTRIASVIIFIYSLFCVYLFYPKFWLLLSSGGLVAEKFLLYATLSACLFFCGSGRYAVKQD